MRYTDAPRKPIETMTKLAISGAAGRMGGALIRLLANHPRLHLGQALEQADNPAVGQDSGSVAGTAANRVAVTAQLDASAFDLLVEFTRPDATLSHLAECVRLGKACVIGTTGLSRPQTQSIEQAARHIPIVLTANTSIGINLCAALAGTAADVLGDRVDIEIVEAHHKHKTDAPSGTALLLAEAIAGVRGKDLERDGVYTRHGQVGPRIDGSIGFSAIRGGDIVGEHTILFIGESERIEITHRATDRVIFARGALRAADWLSEKQQAGAIGLFDMQDVLGLAST